MWRNPAAASEVLIRLHQSRELLTAQRRPEPREVLPGLPQAVRTMILTVPVWPPLVPEDAAACEITSNLV